MQTNNELFKDICEAYGITIDSGVHTNNYYLKRIAEKVCGTSYTKTTCNGKYLKDIAEKLSGTIYSSHHFINFYLKEICIALNPGSTYDNKSDNYLLQVWKASVIARKLTTSLTISLDKNFLEIGERVTVSGRLTDSDGNPIANAPLISHSNSQTANMTTDANGEYSIKWYYSTSAYNTVAHHYVTYAGNWKYKESQSETKEVSFRRTSTLLLETPVITYTDEFDVQGSLTDGLGEPISYADVTLTWNDGSDHTATTTTSPTGGILLHRDAVTHTGTYSFQLSFDGGSRYVASNSSVVNVVPNKEESVLNIRSPISPARVGGSGFTMRGTLKDDDGEPLEDKELEVIQYVPSVPSDVTIATAKVDENGDWSCSVPTTYLEDEVDTTLTVKYNGNHTYTSSQQSFIVTKVPVDSLADLSLVEGKDILSYADRSSGYEYATLMTYLLNGQSPAMVEGVDVDFYKYVDGTNDVYLDTVMTDANGRAEYTYETQGAGDVEIYAKLGTLLTKTFTISDIYKYAPTEISKTSSSSSTAKIFPYDFALDSEHFEMEFDIKMPNNGFAIGLSPSTNSNFQYNIGLGRDGGGTNCFRTWKPTSATTNEGTTSSKTASLNTYYTIKYVYDNGSCSIYADDTLLITYTGLTSLYQGISKTIGLQSWDTGTYYIKNVKIKAL